MIGVVLGTAETGRNENIIIEIHERESARFLILRPRRIRKERARRDEPPSVWKCHGIKIGLGRAQGVIDALQSALLEARARGYFDDYEPRRVA